MAEINFLRMIYLLYSVACPVVQIKLDNENKLWENRMNMHEQYKETETSSHGHNWGLSYKGKTVKSDNFENRLSMILVRIVDKIKMGDAYPKSSDVSDRTMLSRLKYIKNKAAQRLKADLSEDKFNHKWDKIKKAVRTLAQTLNLENDKDNTRLIDNLKVVIKQIPEGCHLHQRDNKYTVLTTEENNFLVAFYVLATIVHPLINTKCTNRILETDMNFRKKRLQYWEDDYEITKQDKQQHHSTKKEESRNLNILRVNTRKEDEKDHQLEVIIAIQREIEQNSSGILNENRLRDFLKCTRKAVLQLGGEWNEEKILSLQNEIIF